MLDEHSASAPTPERWHDAPIDAVLARLCGTDAGLSAEEAAVRLRRHGPNRLPTAPPRSLAAVFAHQFRSPLIYVLAVAAAVAFLIGDRTDAAFIFAVLLINATIGTWQEWKAEQGMQALQRYLQIKAAVVRDGVAHEVDAESLVPGDVVLVESGNRVPADLRLLSATSLEVDESLLTGESLPVGKDPAWTGPDDAPIGDRINMLHAGSTIVRGRARAIVVATGSHTALGALAVDVLGADRGKPPLVIRMERFTRIVAIAVLVMAVSIGGVAVTLRGFGIGDAFLLIVALAVSAIPEGLPAAMTVALAVATHRMAKRSVIVRRLAAVEGLGSCTFIASDKTGTLTVNQLTAREIRLPDGRRVEITGQGFAPTGELRSDGMPVPPGTDSALVDLVRAAVLCNEGELRAGDDGWTWHGDSTDVALLSLAHKAGWNRPAALERHPEVDRIPFEPEHRFAAAYHRDGDRVCVFVKGAPERVLAMCSGIDPNAQALADEMAQAGLRVLAFADGDALDITGVDPPATPRDLRFLGMVGMIDPLRAGAAQAVVECGRAGIAVAMVTGDHPVTALAIARALGLAQRPDQVVTGAEIDAISDRELADRVASTRVFARVAPQQKLRIVAAAQAAGHFVAVTGDGVNDAPALRQANIGVAMGKSGTDVAREASELVITDDDFTSIVGGIEEGRVAYDNIRKVIYLLISTGAAELVLASLAVAFGTPIPLLPVQLLWLNLVTNGIQDVALAFEPGERDVMQRPPRRPREGVFNRLMIERTVVAASVMAAVGFALFTILLRSGWSEAAARNAVLLLMVLFENVHVGNCRSETRSAFVMSPFQTPILLGGTILAFTVHVIAMHVPFMQSVLGTMPVSSPTWLVLATLALTVLVAIEIHKWTWRRRHRSPVGDIVAV